MKKLFALLLSLLLLSGCAATYDGPTTGEYLLTEVAHSHYAFDRLQYTRRTTYTYDIHGNLVQEMMYKDEELEDAFYYRYDDRGNRISEWHWDHSGLIPLPQKSAKSTYDDQDRILTAIYYDGWGRETHRLSYTYDEKTNSYTCQYNIGEPDVYYLDESGRTVRVINNAGDSTYEYHYEYDAWGHLIRSQVSREGTQYIGYEARYDDRGRLLWEGHYDKSGKLQQETSTEYNDDDHTGTTRKSWGTELSYYDADGRVYLTEEYDPDGSLSEVIRYTYQQIQVPLKGVETP